MAKESNIITKLKSVRESRSMTQQELADRIGMRRETILHLENNRYNPSLEMALKIAQVFDLRVEELFQLKDIGGQSGRRFLTTKGKVKKEGFVTLSCYLRRPDARNC